MPLTQWLKSNNKSKRKYDLSEEEAYDGSDSGLNNNDYYPKVAVGCEFNCIVSVESSLRDAGENNMNFICIPLFHPRFRRDYNTIVPSLSPTQSLSMFRKGAVTRSDMCISNDEWMSTIIGKISDWIDLSSNTGSIVKSSEIAIKQEYLYAAHLVIIAVPRVDSPNFCRSLVNLCMEKSCSSTPQVWLRIPFIGGWEKWDYIRHQTGHQSRIFVVLDVSNSLLTDDGITTEQVSAMAKKWIGEPVKAVCISTNSFFTAVSKKNKSKLQLKLNLSVVALLNVLFRFDIHVILNGTVLPNTSMSMYCELLERLCLKSQPVEDDAQILFQQFSFPFRDSLQTPLHPLSDNLDSDTYRVMEQDPVKYDSYEIAICKALLNRKNDKRRKEKEVVVLVVGAGRGPLVQATLNASVITGVVVKIVAVDKNFNAIVTLRNRFAREQSLEVVWSDMRELKQQIPNLQADVVVSELLGSWGDNELSPECLLAVETSDILREGGVMIPQSYESFLSPVTTHPLWTQARDMQFLQQGSGNKQSGLDSPYVVHLHNHRVLAESQPVFKFVHPIDVKTLSEVSKFSGSQSLSFIVSESVTIHGFAGFFNCCLFGDVILSTIPSTHSHGMFSWFPIFLPITNPLKLQAGEIVTINIWRCTSPVKVWYEWCISHPIVSAIQNSQGCSYSVHL